MYLVFTARAPDSQEKQWLELLGALGEQVVETRVLLFDEATNGIQGGLWYIESAQSARSLDVGGQLHLGLGSSPRWLVDLEIRPTEHLATEVFGGVSLSLERL